MRRAERRARFQFPLGSPLTEEAPGGASSPCQRSSVLPDTRPLRRGLEDSAGFADSYRKEQFPLGSLHFPVSLRSWKMIDRRTISE
jgi:hypothetical protein